MWAGGAGNWTGWRSWEVEQSFFQLDNDCSTSWSTPPKLSAWHSWALNLECTVGMDLFSWNKEISAIYSHRQKTHSWPNTWTILFPEKQRPSILKKDQWTVIVLSFLRNVSFPVLHQLWQPFPWWRGQHFSVCMMSIMVPKSHIFLSHTHTHTHTHHSLLTIASMLECYCLFCVKPGATPYFWELKWKDS